MPRGHPGCPPGHFEGASAPFNRCETTNPAEQGEQVLCVEVAIRVSGVEGGGEVELCVVPRAAATPLF